MRKCLRFFFLFSAALTLATVQPASAELVGVSCDSSNFACTFSASINGQPVLNGRFGLDEKGNVIFTEPVSASLGDGGPSVEINGLFGNADPILGFAIGANTPDASGAAFAFSFFLPIAIDGPIDAKSQVGYVLTSRGAPGAQITPTGGASPFHVVTAFEIDTSVGGLGALSKGVDVGDLFALVNAGPGGLVGFSDVYEATNSFTGNLAYDLMAVNLNFALSANSNAAISGFVEQTEGDDGDPNVPVPEPSSMLLLGSGVLAMARAVRKSRRDRK